jgi:SulP family sulfate permease
MFYLESPLASSALPLAMAFAIASGLKPEAGIFTAIVAGGLISLLGGSRVQIGGPAGAFIVIVYGIVERYGIPNLLLATVMSGVFLFLMGLMRLGTLVRFIPIAVIIGFTNGIACLIGLSQIKDFFGLAVEKMPAQFFPMLQTLYAAADTVNIVALRYCLFQPHDDCGLETHTEKIRLAWTYSGHGCGHGNRYTHHRLI